jgi:hypothetical protein
VVDVILWGALRRSENKLDGVREHLVFEDCLPVLFKTRREAREYIEDTYGYLRNRPDLQAEPFGWKMPKPVRVRIGLEGDREC